MSDLKRVQSREDILDVVDLAREIWTDHYAPIIGQEQVEYMLGKFQSARAISAQLDNGYEYLTVSHNGRKAGYLAIFPDADADMLMISKIYVLKDERGKGLGRSMLEFAENVCRKRRIGTIWLTVNRNNTSSIAWYMRMGFRNAGTAVQDIGGGFVMDDYRMEKKTDRNDCNAG